MAKARAATAVSFSKASTTGFGVGFFFAGFWWFGGFGGCWFILFLTANTMQVNCKTVRRVLNGHGQPAAQSHPVREPRCCSSVSRKEAAGSGA